MPDAPTLAEVEPVYETLPGWTLPARVERLSDLPAAARLFADRVSALVGVPVTMVGLGQRREEFLRVRPEGTEAHR
jgi:adenylosuccinate synthase